MSISSIVQIANRSLNGDTGQDSQGQGKGRITPAASQAQSNRTEFGDRFTPSAQGEVGNAIGGAGLFQLERLRFTAMNIQTAGGNAPAGTATTAAIPPTPAVAAASPIQPQQDLQALNASLTALGLNAAEISAFDQFAGVLLQFDPNALQDLQNQLNLLVTRFQTQNSAPAVATQTPAACPNFQ
jgi:hypothetical protein